MLRYAELVRGVAERMLQELIEAEATARVGAEWNEHAETRTVLRRRPRATRHHQHHRRMIGYTTRRDTSRERYRRISPSRPRYARGFPSSL